MMPDGGSRKSSSVMCHSTIRFAALAMDFVTFVHH